MTDPNASPPPFVPLCDGIVDLRARVVVRGGQITRLTPLEASLLSYLASVQGQAIPRDQLLKQVWGYRPGVASRTVDTTLRRLRIKVEVDPSSPSILLSEPGVGVRLLPSAVTSRPFVGRTDALAHIDRAARQGVRWIAVVGPGGVGKTCLVRRWCRDRAARIVELAPCPNADELLPTLAAAVGPLPDNDLETIASRVNHPGVWLVLDNLEHLLPDAKSVLVELLAKAPHLKIVATSQRRAEVPGGATLELNPLSTTDAVQLLRTLAPLDFTDVDDPTLQRLADQVGRLPLALELAAARASALGVESFLTTDAPILELLGHPERSGRQGSMRATLEWSWAQLSDSDRRALQMLTVFRGGFEADQARAVLGPVGVLDQLHRLRGACWLTKPPTWSGPTRFDLLEPMRHFVLEEVGPPSPDVVRRHAACFAEMAAVPRRERLDDNNGGERVRNRAAWWNLQAAFTASEATEHFDDAARCLVGLFDAAKAHRGLEPLVASMTRTLRAPGLSPAARAQLGFALADTYRLSGLPGDAEATAILARDLAHRHGLHTVECDAERLLGILALTTADEATAAEHYDRAERLAEATGSLRAQSATANTRGNLHLRAGRLNEAQVHYRRAIELANCSDSRRLMAHAAANLAIALQESGDLDGAAEAYEQALESALSVGDQRQVAMTRGNQGALAADRGHVDEARAGYEEGIELCRELGARRPLVIALLGLAELERRVGNLAKASDCATSAKRELPSARYPFLHWVADAIAAEVAPPTAATLETVLTLEERMLARAIPVESAITACRAGRVALSLGQRAVAEAALARARATRAGPNPDLDIHIDDLTRLIAESGLSEAT